MGLTVFLTVCAILAFYDTFYMNGTLQRYLGKLVTVLAPVLYASPWPICWHPSSTGSRA